MPTFQMIPVDSLEAPENPQRTETLYEGIDSLRDSIRTNGLQQPIGVTRTDSITFRIIWGHRRSIAVTQLGWSHIGAMVYEAGEGNADALMGAENYHRTQTNDAEEARYYKRILPNYPEGTIGLARELNVPQSRIERLLLCLEGDPKVFEAMAAGELSMAQAYEINKFKSPGYRLQALERVRVDNTGADTLRRWRQDIQRQGIDNSAAEQQVTWATPVKPVGQEPLAHCMLGNHEVPLLARKMYDICGDHWNIVIAGLEALGREEVLKEAGYYPAFMQLLHTAEEALKPNGIRIQPAESQSSD